MLGLLALVTPALASTLTVGPHGDYASLWSAVAAASEGDTVDIAAGTYRECVNLGGKSLTLRGAGESETILEGPGDCTPLAAELGETLSVSDLTLTSPGWQAVSLWGAEASLERVSIVDSGGSGVRGGGILLNGGALTLREVTMRDNAAGAGGHIHATGGATLVLEDCLLVGGTARSAGGAIFLDDGVSLQSARTRYVDNGGARLTGGAIYADDEASIESVDDTFSGNAIDTYTLPGMSGGAISLASRGTLRAEGTTFEDNLAYTGGAIWAARGAEITLASVSFEGNRAFEAGGALFGSDDASVDATDTRFEANLAEEGDGGAIHLQTDVLLTLAGGELVANTTGGDGGAIFVRQGGTVTLSELVFEENSAPDGSGGALAASDVVALSVADTRFTGNSAYSRGGAVSLEEMYHTASFVRVQAEENGSSTVAGGVLRASSYSDVEIDDSAFRDNLASGGGAVAVYRYSNLTVSGSEFMENIAQSSNAGAVYFESFASSRFSLAIHDCRFEENESASDGGAIFYHYGRAFTVTSSSFVGNVAGVSDETSFGGAVKLSNVRTTTASNNFFCGNSATYAGGAIYMYGPSGETRPDDWENNIFLENEATTAGGALYADDLYHTRLANNVFVGNAAANGAAYYATNFRPTFINNVVAWSQGGAAVYASDTGALVGVNIVFNDWYENEGGDRGGLYTFSTSTRGNNTADPGFAGLLLDGSCDDDLRLADDSALIDAGIPDVLDADGSTSDIGAYGGPGALSED